MSTAEAVEYLKKLSLDLSLNQEEAHVKADRILLEVLRSNGLAEVADAWESAREEIGFWYA